MLTDDPLTLERLCTVEGLRRQDLGLLLVRPAAAPGRATAGVRTARRFAAYSFAKAHAWSYAIMAYAAVHMKTHHPAAWGCALLNGYGGIYPMRTLAADLQRNGVRLLTPKCAGRASRR